VSLKDVKWEVWAWPTLIGIYFVGVILAWIVGIYRKAKLYDTVGPRAEELDAKAKQLAYEAEGVRTLATQKAIGFPWLADAYADFFHLEDLRVARELETKTRKALKAADEVRKMSQVRREAERKARFLQYQIMYYESLFPWLADLKSEDVAEELIRVANTHGEGEEIDDEARHWLTPEEYRQLPASEKYELALERYWTKKKSKWEVGRDYERYVGYLFETKGSTVHYQGIVEGFDDLGRDLIVRNENETQIVQCKNWSQEKTIHEKHVFQLYGTFIAYRIDHPNEVVSASFVTTTKLSERASMFAQLLGVIVHDGFPLKRYPCIKCHISKRNREKIYHLPFDQQYDRTIIELSKDEFYVSTVKEAEALGFRRAFRYRGLKETVNP
jgi:hypothetical protein